MPFEQWKIEEGEQTREKTGKDKFNFEFVHFKVL
jgi:hypothetical protein